MVLDSCQIKLLVNINSCICFVQEQLSSEQFCKRYLFSHYNLEVEEQPSGHLRMWSEPNSWFCAWAQFSDANAWVFSDLPKRWKCGIVHLADYSLEADRDLKYKDLCRAVHILSRIQKAATPEELRLDCGKCFRLKMTNASRMIGCFFTSEFFSHSVNNNKRFLISIFCYKKNEPRINLFIMGNSQVKINK